jgi:hypothetical protein
LEFVGSQERIHLSVAANGAIENSPVAEARTGFIEASRHTRDTELLPLAVGQMVAIGVKHLHVLPTRISSLKLVADNDAARLRLKNSGLVATLAGRMRLTPQSLGWPAGDATCQLAGLPIIAVDEGQDLSSAVALLNRGVSHVLALGHAERAIQRLVIFAQDSRPARDAALGLAGSLLRHLSVEATLLVPANESLVHGARYRDLLDIRNAAQHNYGVDLRTESFHGSLTGELRNQLQDPQASLLVLGMTSLASASELFEQLVELSATVPFDAILLTCARGGSEPAPAWAELRNSKIAQAR